MIPCRCCGRANHSTFRVVEQTSTGISKVIFTCPMATKKTPIVWNIKLRNLIIWPTARRFAEHHQFQKETAIRALTSFHKYGSGRWMNISRAKNFRNEVISECECMYKIRENDKGNERNKDYSCIN